MKNFTLLLIFCLISFATMFGQAATVRVQDGSGAAIMDAAVILNATTVLTDANGEAIFPGLADGNYPYSVTADCYEGFSGALDVAGADVSVTAALSLSTTNDLFINLVPPGGIGFPPAGVTVRVYNDDLSYDETVVTGGFTQLTDVPYGTYNYTLSQDCKVTVTGTTTVECTPGDIDALVAEFGVNQTTNDLFINLVPPGGIGFPPAGVTVRVYNDDLSYDETVVTGGFTQLTDVPYGTYNYTLSQDCKVTVTGTTTVECTPGDIDALVAEFGVNQTTNNVFFFIGNLFQEPDVTITLTNTTTFEQTSITGQNFLGDYILENLPYGDYNYTVSKECFVSQTGQVTVDCQPNDGEGNQLGNIVALGDLVPNTTNNVFFFIGNLFQEPDVTITLTNTTTFEQTSITGQNFLGDYILENLPYGDYNYTVSKECFVSQTGQVTVDCQPNDGEGNQLGNIVALGDLVPNTTNNVFFFIGNLFQEPDVTITLTNTATSEQTSITGQNFLGDYILENLPYGDYNYTVSKECFVSQTGQVTVDCQPNDGEGNQLGNIVALGDLVPNVLDNSVTQVGETLTANATGVSYQWILCDGTEIDGETNAFFTPIVTGDYAVVVTDDNCSISSTSECFPVTIVGVTSLSTDNLSFYPNPVQDELRINFEENVNDVKIRIFNINGQLIINQEFPQAEMIKVDMSKLLPGTYILDLTVDGESLKTPIVKM